MQGKIGVLRLQTCVVDSFLYIILCVLTCATRKLKSYKDILPIELLLYYRRCILWARARRYACWVMDPNTHCVLFRYNILCVLMFITWKLQVVYGCTTYRTTAPLSVVSIFCVRAGCEVRLASYGSKYAWQCLYDKPFVHTYTHNLKITGHMWTFNILNDCSSIGDIVCVAYTCVVAWEVQLENYTASDTHQCVYCQPVHTLLFGVHRGKERLDDYSTFDAFSDTAVCAYTASPYIHCY